MAIRERRECDVYGTTKDVRLITIEYGVTKEDVPMGNMEADLCPRAIKRLVKFIERGISKPSRNSKPTEPAE